MSCAKNGGKICRVFSVVFAVLFPVGALDHASNNDEKEARKLHNILKECL